jgi:ABC-type branched-subunit amino acid transport system substrate-binding protein
VPLLVCLSMLAVLAACGQKPGVHVASSESNTAGNSDSSGGSIEPGDQTDVGATDGSGAGAGTDSGSTGGGSTGATGGGSTGGGGGAAAAELKITGKDRTGISATTINLAVHAPVTGAAPLPADSFQKSSDLYFRYVIDKGEKILGRSKVVVSFKDDKYTPNTAIQACRELSTSNFLLVGAGGTDQIQACAQFAEKSGIPYFSPGVTEVGLNTLKDYFTTGMTYPAQTDLLAQYVKKNFPGKKAGAIITNTPNFDDAANEWDKAVKTQGLPYYKTLRHPKGNNSWITTYASEMKSNGVQVLFILSSPVDYIQFAQQSGTQGYHPQYVGVGVSKGLNAVLGAGCPDVDGGVFFSPFPGLDWARANMPEFFEAGKKFGVPTDDIALAIWGFESALGEAFKRYEQVYKSTDLTREDFVKMLQTQSGITTKSNPVLSYTPTNHFGAKQVHVLKADCASGEHKTLATFASGF